MVSLLVTNHALLYATTEHVPPNVLHAIRGFNHLLLSKYHVLLSVESDIFDTRCRILENLYSISAGK
jgi:hypothetical protein